MRVAATSTALFVVAAAVLLGVILWIVAGSQRAALLQANDEDIATVLVGFKQEGIGEAEEVLHQRLGDPPYKKFSSAQSYMRIQGRLSGHSLGNLPAVPETIGQSRLTFQDPHVTVLGRGVRLNEDYYLFVGRDLATLADTRGRILQAFVWLMLGSIAVAAFGGVMLAQRLIRRVDAVTKTCEGIMAGRFDERIAGTGAGSEWDRLAGAINEMLNRIGGLLENLQQVSSDVAHDLRTPLSRMRHRLESARNGEMSTPKFLAAIDRGINDTDHLLALFDAVLRISQIEAGTRAASFQPVDLDRVLTEVAELYRPLAEDSERILDCIGLPGAWVNGDSELLFQMLSNLVENSIRHTPVGSRIELRISRSRARIVCQVADNGGGIPQAELGKVTRRFYRLEGSRSSPGHGLGLALVSATAHLHGATLTLENASPGLTARVELQAL